MSWALYIVTLLTLHSSFLCSRYANDFFLSDAALFDKAQKGLIGQCQITGSCGSCFCRNYAKVLLNGNSLGLPDRYGSGCLGRGCWGPPNTYHLYSNTPLPICTGNTIKDGANMIRIGIVKGFCDFYGLRSSAPTLDDQDNTSSTNANTSILSSSQDSNNPSSDNYQFTPIKDLTNSLVSSSQSNLYAAPSSSQNRKFQIREILILAGFILSGVFNIIFGIYICRGKGAKGGESEPQREVSDPQKQVDSSNKLQVNK